MWMYKIISLPYIVQAMFKLSGQVISGVFSELFLWKAILMGILPAGNKNTSSELL